jgi:DNA-binding transcriptional regulator YhcF (GntR family)
MILRVDLTSAVPLYQQLRDRVVEGIATGELPAGSSLPASRPLAADFGINFHTVTKAYDLLRQEGLVRLTRKTGAVVQRDARSGPPGPGFVEGWETRLRTLLAEAVAQGAPSAEVLDRCQSVLASFSAPGADSGGSR